MALQSYPNWSPQIALALTYLLGDLVSCMFRSCHILQLMMVGGQPDTLPVISRPCSYRDNCTHTLVRPKPYVESANEVWTKYLA